MLSVQKKKRNVFLTFAAMILLVHGALETFDMLQQNAKREAMRREGLKRRGLFLGRMGKFLTPSGGSVIDNPYHFNQ